MGIWQEKGVFLIHIRDYVTNNYGYHIPQKNGIALNKQAWDVIFKNMDHINQDIQTFF